MTWEQAFDDYGLSIASRSELLAAGATGRGVTGAVKAGYLIRVRRDHYALPGTAKQILQGVRVGGRLTCVSALQLSGIFAFDARCPHIHMRKEASRSRSPRSSLVALSGFNRDGAELHWWPLILDSPIGLRI